MKIKIYILIIFLSIFCFSPIYSQRGIIGDKIEIGIEEHLNTYIPENIEIVNEEGKTVNLKSLIDKPTILNFVYYRCPGICSPLMSGLAEVIGNSDLILGKDYQVFTISFDHRESTDLAVKKKKNYLNEIGKEVNKNGWLFFTGDSSNLMKATNAAGFKFKRTGNDFLHSASLIMLSPEAKITRYLNGTYFLPFDIKMAVIEANKGKSGPTINKVLQFCYSYDPVGQSYVLNVTKVTGSIILFFAILLFLFLMIRSKKKKKALINE
ncbi:SCO family protein [candidate division KSB1 bacterium]